MLSSKKFITLVDLKELPLKNPEEFINPSIFKILLKIFFKLNTEEIISKKYKNWK